MSKVSARATVPTSGPRDRMHALRRRGGRGRPMAPQIVRPEAARPHDDRDRSMRAIDSRLEDPGRDVLDPPVRARWDHAGLPGRRPRCGGQIPFTIRGKRAITPAETAAYPQPPDDGHARATIR